MQIFLQQYDRQHKLVSNLSPSLEPNTVPEQGIDGHFLPRDVIPQYIIGEGGEAEEGLQDGIHIASVAKVGKSKVIGMMGEKRKKHIRPLIQIAEV